MESPSTYSHNPYIRAPLRSPRRFPTPEQRHAGFSFIEVMVVMALVGIIATWGLIAGFNSFERYNFRSEADAAVSLLQKARSSAVNNITELPHGVYFGDADDLILFRGANHDALPAEHIRVQKSGSVTHDASGCAGEEVVFEQLSGRTAGCTITLSGETQTISITTNTEGGIIW